MARTTRILGVDAETTVHANAALIVPVRVSELLAWERFIHDPARVPELHQMRIAAKRLRYTLEIFAPCYGRDLGSIIERVKWVQEQLGDIHDADVLVPEMRAQAAELLAPGKRERDAGVYAGDYDAAAGLIALCRLKRAEREATYRRFLAGWREMRSSGFFESLRRILWEAAEPGRSPTAAAEVNTPAPRQDAAQEGDDDGAEAGGPASVDGAP